MMFPSLRARLLLSYVAIISLTLCVVSVALVLILLRNPIPTLEAYRRLTDIAQESLPSLGANIDQIDEGLARLAAARDIRALRLGTDNTALFDSTGQIQAGQAVTLRVTQVGDGPGQRGTFRDPAGRVWLYVAYDTQNTRHDVGLIVLLTPRPRPRIVDLFGENMLPSLIQAGTISLVVSVVLAVLISNSVARPLRLTASAANAIAGGDYGQQAPEVGPREVRDLARAFNNMSEQVQRAQQTQRDFLANVSHELKTPLTSIQGYSQAILDGAAASPKRAARVIYDEAGRMRRLVEDLLDLARIESGQAHLSRGHVNLSELLHSVLEGLALRAAEQGVTLAHEVNTLPGLTGDNDRLAQVFANLIDNALTHTPAGGQVMVSAGRADSGVQIAVSDTGKGISAKDLSRIFERFYQVDKSRTRTGRKGTGLGLTISKEIIEAHGGTIRVESIVGEGTTFTVWLPLPRPTDETVARSSAHRPDRP